MKEENKTNWGKSTSQVGENQTPRQGGKNFKAERAATKEEKNQSPRNSTHIHTRVRSYAGTETLGRVHTRAYPHAWIRPWMRTHAEYAQNFTQACVLAVAGVDCESCVSSAWVFKLLCLNAPPRSVELPVLLSGAVRRYLRFALLCAAWLDHHIPVDPNMFPLGCRIAL